MAKNDHIPLDYLRECFDLNEATGHLIWRSRPQRHFRTYKGWAMWSCRYVGKSAGRLHWKGYCYVKLMIDNKAHQVAAHRIVFAFTHGRWPTDQVDHVNGIRNDNRPSNLREAVNAENTQNQSKPSRNNRSGYLGVSRHHGKWLASITVNRRMIRIGRFDTPEAAHAAYLEAKTRLHPFAAPSH